MCEAERVVIFPDEKIVFTRTIPSVPHIFPTGWIPPELAGKCTLHELGAISNVCADWEMVLSQGLLRRKRIAMATRRCLEHVPAAVEFLGSAIEAVDAVLALTARYADAARQMGDDDLAEILENVPASRPRSFHEALQSLLLLHAVVWLSGHYHVGLGRFDQYMWPYLKADLDSGRLTIEEAEELLAEFFISLNKDSDLYPGVQQGDNGQTIMLGGVKKDGTDAVNDLTWMALRVAREVAMIDPKINLRISSKTDLDLLCAAAELTRIGLGFPQYSNDDAVIPALLDHGYDLEDARDYTVAACWEFIIPGKGMEVVNIGAVSFPAAVDRAVRQGLAANDTFEGILRRVSKDIYNQLDNLAKAYSRLVLPPAPYYSVLMDGCLERGRDMSDGLKYNNFGVHGACVANASDALAAVSEFVFDERSVMPTELLDALNADFERYESLRWRLAEEAPKVGNNDDFADEMMIKLFDYLSRACERYGNNSRGGIFRPGTGSAMYYVWLARGKEGMREPTVGATAEGRRKGDFFSANLAPSLNARVRGPISVLQSFSKINYQRVFNGGPITMELSDTVFRGPESTRKVAMFISTFAKLGCQQLQLNTVSYEKLVDARKNPERYRNLIVRVWGWSAYFTELDPEYQDHIIARARYTLA